MSCNGCRVLRRGCSENCILRPCLETMPQGFQGNAAQFVAKKFGRAGLMSALEAVKDPKRRILIFHSLLREACARVISPTFGIIGIIGSSQYAALEKAVQDVLRDGYVTTSAVSPSIYEQTTSVVSYSIDKQTNQDWDMLFKLLNCQGPSNIAGYFPALPERGKNCLASDGLSASTERGHGRKRGEKKPRILEKNGKCGPSLSSNQCDLSQLQRSWGRSDASGDSERLEGYGPPSQELLANESAGSGERQFLPQSGGVKSCSPKRPFPEEVPSFVPLGRGRELVLPPKQEPERRNDFDGSRPDYIAIPWMAAPCSRYWQTKSSSKNVDSLNLELELTLGTSGSNEHRIQGNPSSVKRMIGRSPECVSAEDYDAFSTTLLVGSPECLSTDDYDGSHCSHLMPSVPILTNSLEKQLLSRIVPKTPDLYRVEGNERAKKSRTFATDLLLRSNAPAV